MTRPINDFRSKRRFYKLPSADVLATRKRGLFDANPELESALDVHHPIINDIRQRFDTWGKLSDKQVALVLKIARESAKKRAKWAAESAAAAAWDVSVEAGRADVEGEIVSAKWKWNEWGEALKVVVKLDDGRKTYGSVPSAIADPHVETTDARGAVPELVGTRVRFTARLKISDKDPAFAFHTRPSGWVAMEVA
jgi:hypothetical protein